MEDPESLAAKLTELAAAVVVLEQVAVELVMTLDQAGQRRVRAALGEFAEQSSIVSRDADDASTEEAAQAMALRARKLARKLDAHAAAQRR